MLPIYVMPGHLIRRLHQIHAALFAEECAAFDVTAVQFAALTALQAYPGTDATRLSALIAFDRSTIGDVLDRMEAKSWVRRGPSPSDRRVKLLALTPQGEALLTAVGASVARVQERLLAPLSPADREVALRAMRTIAAAHNEATPAPLRAG